MGEYNIYNGLDLAFLTGSEQFGLFKCLVIERLEKEYAKAGVNLCKDSINFDSWTWNTDRNNYPVVRHCDNEDDVINSGCVRNERQLRKFINDCDINVLGGK